jgi:mannosyl-oligosaccharide glucosidase
MIYSKLLSIISILSSPVLSSTTEAFSTSHNSSLLWGPYRPNLYFGLRPRIPDSLLTSLLWVRVEDFERIQHQFRHTCEQGDDMAGYGWTRYDPRSGGVQVIRDPANGIDMEVQWVKDGDDWGVRVKGTPREDEDVKTTIVWGVAVEGLLGSADIHAEGDQRGSEGDVTIKGETPTLGQFKMVVTEGKGRHPEVSHPAGEERPLDRTFVQSSSIPQEHLWQTKALLFNALAQSFQTWVSRFGQENSPPPWQFYTLEPKPESGNHHLIQKTFEGAFEFDVLYGEGITSDKITKLIKASISNFDDKFDSAFKPQAPFKNNKFAELSKSLFSNLLGGIGFFHGDQKIDRTMAPEYEEENEGFWEESADARGRVVPKTEGPTSLFTSIPSRPFFPRGFLWDEGFHLLPVMDWDIDLALDIVRSWFSLIDEDGWIPREVILGDEARSKVPNEFQIQYPHYANPPTLFLILADYVTRLGASQKPGETSQLLATDAAKAYLTQLYPLLTRHYSWFRRTQAADPNSYDRSLSSPRESYRWRGRTPTHCLTSGLDDYPRAQPPHPGEMNIDAVSWVGLMANSLRRVAEFLGEDEDAKKFKKQEDGITNNVRDGVFWDEEAGVWCDVTIDDFEEEKRVCHVGYVSLMPFIVGLIDPKDAKIGKVLDVIRDENGIWSEYGIRSLSKQDPEYGTGENYWKSPIWINMNYLIVDRLRVSPLISFALAKH